MRSLAAVLSTVLLACTAACGGAQQSAPKDFEARLKKLEDELEKRKEALEFLQQAYNQQKAQMEAMEESEPDPDSVFAVDIEPAVKAGQVEGSANALVTIVEAWDFA